MQRNNNDDAHFNKMLLLGNIIIGLSIGSIISILIAFAFCNFLTLTLTILKHYKRFYF